MTPDLMPLAGKLNHFDGCTSPEARQIEGQRGDAGLRCETCGTRWFPSLPVINGLRPAAQAHREPTPERRELVIPATPTPRSSGWPTHRARARGRRR